MLPNDSEGQLLATHNQARNSLPRHGRKVGWVACDRCMSDQVRRRKSESFIRRYQVDGCGVAKALRLIRSSRGGRDANHVAPIVKGSVAGGTIFVGSQSVAAELKVVVDAAMGGQEALRVAR